MTRPENAAIWYAQDGFDPTAKGINGRRVAGESFLRGFLTHARAEDFVALTHGPGDEQHFRDFAARVGVTRPIRGVRLDTPAAIACAASITCAIIATAAIAATAACITVKAVFRKAGHGTGVVGIKAAASLVAIDAASDTVMRPVGVGADVVVRALHVPAVLGRDRHQRREAEVDLGGTGVQLQLVLPRLVHLDVREIRPQHR